MLRIWFFRQDRVNLGVQSLIEIKVMYVTFHFGVIVNSTVKVQYNAMQLKTSAGCVARWKRMFSTCSMSGSPARWDKSAGLQAGLFSLIYHENILLGEFP